MLSGLKKLANRWQAGSNFEHLAYPTRNHPPSIARRLRPRTSSLNTLSADDKWHDLVRIAISDERRTHFETL